MADFYINEVLFVCVCVCAFLFIFSKNALKMNIIKMTFQISDLPLNEMVKQDLKCIVV